MKSVKRVHCPSPEIHITAVCVAVLFAFGIGGVPRAAFSASTTVAVGYADVDITPKMGVGMPGYFSERKATGILDPLRAKALVVTQGNTTLAIVALDLIGVGDAVVKEIRKAVQEQTGISAPYVFVHATHTHTGGNVSEIEEQLPGQVASAVKEAVKRQVAESHVGFGTAREETIAFIRRYLMKDGTVRTNPGRGNPNIVRPIGEIDPVVRVVRFETAKTLLVNYGLHLDCVGGTQFSADYPYHMTEAVRESLGAEWNVLFLNGCCGNINHINVKNKEQRSGYDESRRIGRTLAQAVLVAYRNAAPIEIDRVDARAETVQCPVRKVSKELYEWAQQQMKADSEAASKRKFNEPTPSRIIALAENKETSRPAEILALRLGPIAIAGLPGEVFVENARDIRTHSLFEHTLVIGLTGGAMGYVPHPRGYDEGGYEATHAGARYSPETPVLWCDTAIRLLKELNQ